VLNKQFHEKYDPEGSSIEKSSEHINWFGFSVNNNSAVDHVEQVHQEEGVEASEVFLHSSSWFFCKWVNKWGSNNVELFFFIEEHDLTTEHKKDHNTNLVSNLWQDVSPHVKSNNFSFSAFSWKAFLIFSVNEWLSTDGTCSESVHDQVHPE